MSGRKEGRNPLFGKLLMELANVGWKYLVGFFEFQNQVTKVSIVRESDEYVLAR